MLKKMLIAFALLALFFLGLSRLLKIGEGGTERLASYVLYPFLLVEKKLGGQRCPASSLDELVRYKELHDNLVQEVIHLKSLINYRELTAQQEEFLKRYEIDKKYISQILFKNFDESHFFIVDAGENKGITKEMIAVYKDCLLGRVVEVYPHYSKVLLITDPTCKVAAVCTSTGVKGIHEGLLKLDMTRLSYVDQLEKILKDDLVISSGEGIVFPRGFGLGRVQEVVQDGYSAYVLVTPLIDLKSLEYCALLYRGVVLKEAQTEA